MGRLTFDKCEAPPLVRFFLRGTSKVPMFCRHIATVILILTVLPMVLPAQKSPDKSVQTIHAIRTSEKIRIDGILDDKVWDSAPPATAFTQRDPDEGKAPT